MRISDSWIINNVITTKADLRVRYYCLLLCIEELILSKPDAHTLNHLNHAMLMCYPDELLLLSVELDYAFYPQAFVKESAFEKAMNNFLYKAVFKHPKVDSSFIKDINFACEISAYPEYKDDVLKQIKYNKRFNKLKPKYYYIQSEKHLEKGNYVKADYYINTYLKLKPGCARGFIQKADVEWVKYNKEEADYYYEKALKTDPDYKVLIYLKKAKHYIDSCQAVAALDLLNALITENSYVTNIDNFWYFLAEAHHTNMDNKRALKAINNTRSVHFKYYDLQGKILRDLLKYKESKIAFIRSFNLENDDQTYIEIKDLEYLAGDVDYISIASLTIPENFYSELKYLKSQNH